MTTVHPLWWWSIKTNPWKYYFSQGRWSTATETFTDKLNRNFSPQEAYQLQGRMLNALINFGRPAEARLILNPLLSATATKTIEIAQMEARLLRLEGKSQEALDMLKSIVPESHEHEHLHQEIAALKMELEQSSTWTDAQALRLAELYESVGQAQQAAYCRQQVQQRR